MRRLSGYVRTGLRRLGVGWTVGYVRGRDMEGGSNMQCEGLEEFRMREQGQGKRGWWNGMIPRYRGNAGVQDVSCIIAQAMGMVLTYKKEWIHPPQFRAYVVRRQMFRNSEAHDTFIASTIPHRSLLRNTMIQPKTC